MQAALMMRSKQRVEKRRKLRKLGGRLYELPSNVATKEIAPFPRYPPESWCAQGKAAWLERGRRCSVQDNNTASCQKKWIQDSSLAGSSDDEDLLGVLRGPSSFANAFLYVGLGTVAIGLVIAFVGTGEKGFKTVELRLIGPSLIGIGLICCILRICFCICPSHCISSSRRARKKNSNKVDADHTTSLLRGESKRVSIAKGPQKFPLMRKKSNNKMLNEGMEALRQIATTSLFLQNEQKPSTTSNRVVPIIKEPAKLSDSPLEMKKLDTTLNISDITDDEDEDDSDLATGGGGHTVTIAATTSNYHDNNNLTNININNNNSSNVLQQKTAESLQRTPSKLGRQRVSINQQSLQQKYESPQQQQTNLDNDTLLMETSLMIINPTPPPSSSATRITTTSDITATTTNTNSFSNFSNNNNNSNNNKSTILAPPPLSQLPLQQQSLLTPSIATTTTTTTTSSYKTPLNSLIQSNHQATPATPPTTTLLAPRTSYDLPPTIPHQQLMQQQHTPGQILDNTTSSKHNFGSSTTSTSSGYFGSKINNSKNGTSIGNNEISPLLLTPSLLPGSTGPYANNYLNSTTASTSSSASNKVCFNLNPSTSSNLTTSSQTTEPSELVLSPSKLGQ